MLYSGAELIRTSGQQIERQERLKVVEPVKPVESPAQPRSSLDQDTQNALLRFARFIHKEGESKKDKKAPSKSTPKTIPGAYHSQIENRYSSPQTGHSLDVYV